MCILSHKASVVYLPGYCLVLPILGHLFPAHIQMQFFLRVIQSSVVPNKEDVAASLCCRSQADLPIWISQFLPRSAGLCVLHKVLRSSYEQSGMRHRCQGPRSWVALWLEFLDLLEADCPSSHHLLVAVLILWSGLVNNRISATVDQGEACSDKFCTSFCSTYLTFTEMKENGCCTRGSVLCPTMGGDLCQPSVASVP